MRLRNTLGNIAMIHSFHALQTRQAFHKLGRILPVNAFRAPLDNASKPAKKRAKKR